MTMPRGFAKRSNPGHPTACKAAPNVNEGEVVTEVFG